jgi:hypothetical protein
MPGLWFTDPAITASRGPHGSRCSTFEKNRFEGPTFQQRPRKALNAQPGLFMGSAFDSFHNVISANGSPRLSRLDPNPYFVAKG